MGKISLDIAKFKSAGVYTLEYDNTETQTVDTDSLRLLVGFNSKGPFNRPVYLSSDSDRQKIFGDIDTKLEHKGAYFNRFAQTLLTQGPILALNLLNVDDSQNGPDQVNYAAMSLAAATYNPIVVGKNAQYDYIKNIDASIYGSNIDTSYIPFIGGTPYASLFDRSKFWTVSDANLTAIVSNQINNDVDNSGIYDKSNFLNFANVGTEEFSILVIKPTGLSGYDITAKDWYGSEDNIPYGWIRPSDYVSEYFLQVICVKGNWSNYPVLAADPTWSAYFDEKGIKRNMITQFVSAEGVELLGSWTGSIIPDFTNKQGGNMSLINRINNNTEVTGLLAAFNEDAAQVLTFDYNGIDNEEGVISGGKWVYDYDSDHEANSADGESEAGFLIDMVGHNFQKGISQVIKDTEEIEDVSYSVVKNGENRITHLLQADETGYDWTYVKFIKVKDDGSYDTATKAYVSSSYDDAIVFDSSVADSSFTTTEKANAIAVDNEKDTLELLQNIVASDKDEDTILLETFFTEPHHKKVFKYNTIYKVYSTFDVSTATENAKENAVVNTESGEKILGIYAYVSPEDDTAPYTVSLYHMIQSTTADNKVSFRSIGSKTTDNNGFFTINWTDADGVSHKLMYQYDGENFVKVVSDTQNTYAISFLSYDYVTNDPNDITETFTDSYYFYDPEVFDVAPVTSATKNMFISFDENCVGVSNRTAYNNETESRGLKVGDYVQNIAFNNEENSAIYHVIPGLTRVIAKVFVSVDQLSGEFTYKGSTYTMNADVLDNLLEDSKGVKGFYLFTTTDAVLVDNNTVVSQYPITDDIISSSLRFIPLKGLKITKNHKPGYDKNGNISSEGGVEKIYSLLSDEGMLRGLTNPEMVNFRYIVDSMGYGLDAELGGKKYLSYAAMKRGKCTAILNLPSMRQFATSSDPYFCDTYVSGQNIRPPFKTKYIPQGGNDELYATKVFSLPSEENGAKYAAAFWPWLQYTENGKTFNVPPAADVANVFIKKYQGDNPYLICANLNGIISNNKLTGIEYKADTEDRDSLEPFGVNTIISRNGNIMIYGNQTCYQKVKSDFNKLHVREDLNGIEIECEAILQNYNFEYNTAALRASVVTALTPVLQAVQTSGAIDSYSIICDETNNTEEIINNDYGVVDIAVIFNHGMEKIVNRITVNKYGTVLS